MHTQVVTNSYNKLASLVEVSHGNADGIYSAIYGGIEPLMKPCQPNGSNIVCGSFDGASGMTGSRNGKKVKLPNDHPSALIIHCVAHHLGLGISLNAATITIFF